MKKNLTTTLSILMVLAMAFSFIACGGGGSSSVLTYDGNTDPAVADSTTATPLAQAGLNSAAAGFPVVQAFFMEEPGAEPAAAQPLVAYDGTFVTIQIPSDAVIDGAYLGGDGTMTLAGTVTMWVQEVSAGAVTWTVTDAVMNGTVTFDGYYNGAGSVEEQLTGTVTVTDTDIVFSNDPVEFPLADIGSIQDYIDFPIFTDVAITFTHLTVGTGADSYSLGEGDLEFALGEFDVEVYINTLTVSFGGETYKIVDGLIYVAFGPDGVDIMIGGIDIDSDYATVYHPTLGMFYFYASFFEDDLVGDITSGNFEISEDGSTSIAEFIVEYDEEIWGTYYNLLVDGEDNPVEKGYLLDWEFIPDPAVPDILM